MVGHLVFWTIVACVGLVIWSLLNDVRPFRDNSMQYGMSGVLFVVILIMIRVMYFTPATGIPPNNLLWLIFLSM